MQDVLGQLARPSDEFYRGGGWGSFKEFVARRIDPPIAVWGSPKSCWPGELNVKGANYKVYACPWG